MRVSQKGTFFFFAFWYSDQVTASRLRPALKYLAYGNKKAIKLRRPRPLMQ